MQKALATAGEAVTAAEAAVLVAQQARTEAVASADDGESQLRACKAEEITQGSVVIAIPPPQRAQLEDAFKLGPAAAAAIAGIRQWAMVTAAAAQGQALQH